MNGSGVGTLNKSDLIFTVSDNCFSDAEIVDAYNIPSEFSTFDCTQIGTLFITLDQSNIDFPPVVVQVTVESSGLGFDPITTDFCANSSFDLTSLEDQITTANGTFTYTQAIERLYIPNENENTVSVIDLASNSVMTTIDVGNRPAGVAVHPNGKKVYVTNRSNASVSVIDVASNTVEATIGVNFFPIGTAFNSDGSRLYVTNHLSNNVSVINTTTNTVVNTISVGANPWGIALSPNDSKIYVANQGDDNVSVLNASTGSTTTTIAVQNNPHDVALSADGTKIYVGNASGFGIDNNKGAISIIDISTDAVVETLFMTYQDAYDFAVQPTGNLYTSHLFVQGGSISRVEPSSANDITYYNIEDGVTNQIQGISLKEDASILYMVDAAEDKVIFFNTTTNTEGMSIPVGDAGRCTGEFYVKTTIDIADPTAFMPSQGDVINVAFDAGGTCASTTTITFSDNDQVCNTTLLVNAKIFLEGPYNNSTGLMNDDLRQQNLIPNNSPYNATTESVTNGVLSITGSNAIVDWVLLELRSANDHTEILYTRAALLQRDGDLVDLDGLSPVSFEDADEGDYFIAIKHRNHLGTISSTTVSISTSPTTVDFTSDNFSVYGNNSRVELTAGIWGQYSSDVDGSGSVNATDRSATWNDRNQTGYLDSDCNLDGATNASDRSATWNNRNLGGTLPE